MFDFSIFPTFVDRAGKRKLSFHRRGMAVGVKGLREQTQ